MLGILFRHFSDLCLDSFESEKRFRRVFVSFLEFFFDDLAVRSFPMTKPISGMILGTRSQLRVKVTRSACSKRAISSPGNVICKRILLVRDCAPFFFATLRRHDNSGLFFFPLHLTSRNFIVEGAKPISSKPTWLVVTKSLNDVGKNVSGNLFVKLYRSYNFFKFQKKF